MSHARARGRDGERVEGVGRRREIEWEREVLLTIKKWLKVGKRNAPLGNTRDDHDSDDVSQFTSQMWFIVYAYKFAQAVHTRIQEEDIVISHLQDQTDENVFPVELNSCYLWN